MKKPVTKKKDDWVIKDRMYVLKDGLTPLTYSVKTSNIYWFDEEKGYERELKYAANQRTCFVDEMKGDQILGRILFENGGLFVPKRKNSFTKTSIKISPKIKVYMKNTCLQK